MQILSGKSFRSFKSFKGDRRRLCRSLEDGTSAYSLEFKDKEVWRNLTDKDIHTMVCNCVDETEVTERAAYGN